MSWVWKDKDSIYERPSFHQNCLHYLRNILLLTFSSPTLKKVQNVDPVLLWHYVEIKQFAPSHCVINCSIKMCRIEFHDRLFWPIVYEVSLLKMAIYLMANVHFSFCWHISLNNPGFVNCNCVVFISSYQN